MLELAVLGLLREQPLHGYELKKRLGDTLGSFWGVSFGSLYPALRRLERDGAIESVEAEAIAPVTPAPPTGSLAGDLAAARQRRKPRATRRIRKAYRITPLGEQQFTELLSADDGADDDRSFVLRLSLCGALEPVDRIALLDRRRSVLTDRLGRARRPRTGARTTDHYARALLEHRTRSTEHDLAFIDELLTAERRALPDERPEGATA